MSKAGSEVETHRGQASTDGPRTAGLELPSVDLQAEPSRAAPSPSAVRFQYIRDMKTLLLLAALPLGAQELALADFPAGLTRAEGWEWEYFSDRVMGGRSDLGETGVTGEGQDRALRLQGTVVTRGGGFLQVRLGRESGVADLGAWKGVEVTVDAPPGGAYFLHVRTKDTVLPWSYYQAPLPVAGDRVTLRIPWTSLSAVSVGARRPDITTVRSIALVAAFQDFEADLSLYRISLYP